MPPLKPESPLQRRYWRSVDEFARSLRPQSAPEPAIEDPTERVHGDNRWSRRSFLSSLGASLALAGLSGCRKPVEKIVPYVNRPEGMTPGEPVQYATTMPFGGSVLGLLVTSHDGRPTKIEGNPLHPASGGATHVWAQAEMMNLYDPDRSRSPRRDGKPATWEEFLSFWQQKHGQLKKGRGRGLAVLAEPFSSPTMARLKAAFEKTFPQGRWVTWEPFGDEAVVAGCRTAFGKAVRPLYRFDRARVIVSLDADFLQTETDAVRNTGGFSAGRRVSSKQDDMSRLYQVESAYTVTGTMADHRLRLPSSRIPAFALALARELKARGLRMAYLESITATPDDTFDRKWLGAVAKDLLENKGRSVVLAGRRQPAAVHALVCAINEALGNIDSTVEYFPLRDATVSSVAELSSLVDDLRAGRVDTLVMLGGNPVYDAPADLDFREAVKKASASVHLSLHFDETSRLSTWHLNRAHFLESWGDARWTDGTVSPVQPLIAPLFDGRSELELLSLVLTGEEARGYDIVRETWSGMVRGDFERTWRRALHDGLLKDSEIERERVRVDARAVSRAVNGFTFGAAPDQNRLEIVFTLSNVYDGRYSNNGWLQELPDPITKITWDNVAQISVGTARRLGLENGRVVKLQVGGRALEMPVWISPGVADDCVVLALGYGRQRLGRYADGAGVNTYEVRSTEGLYTASGATVSPLPKTHRIAQTQEHHKMEGRPLAREATLAVYRAAEGEDPFKPPQAFHPPLLSLWDEHSYDQGYQWGMTIDLNACTGCNACVVACQSENNIPVVGRDRVAEGREMHWMRIDRYYVTPAEGSNPAVLDDAAVTLLPVNCQHCENAPCETVCPVAATVHDREGLNVMVYNRCIGTRYCSNNCPYKVRRFNFFNYTSTLPELVQMAQNPEVTVRFRGVMEKCTYCVQRITTAKIDAKNEGRTLEDGEVQTACQQVCPAKAITFGNINDPKSRVAALKKSDRNYAMLEELNIKPRTTYLARLRNPNPELES